MRSVDRVLVATGISTKKGKGSARTSLKKR
jgi:hypothetical protein